MLARCVNLRYNEEEETYEDSINFEPVDEEDLISYEKNGQLFCYEPLALWRYFQESGRYELPENRARLTNDEIEELRQRVVGGNIRAVRVPIVEEVQQFLIIDPHRFPTRMTLGTMMELLGVLPEDEVDPEVQRQEQDRLERQRRRQQQRQQRGRR